MSWSQHIYNNFVPRWFKATPWKKILLHQFEEHGKINMVHVYLPFVFFVFFDTTSYAYALMRNKPKTDEERMALRRNYTPVLLARNWEMGQYDNDMPPVYDLWERRQKYPQHYGDRYDGFKRDGRAVGPVDEGAKKKPDYYPEGRFFL